MKGRRGNPGLKGRLVNKSIDAYVLALETINRVSIQYRIEAFCYLICNAWELLLKAKILEDTRNKKFIYHKKKYGKPKRSLSLRACLNKTMHNQDDPTRRNIERIIELRDEAVHLVISQIPSEIILLFQASVINYHHCLNEWFGMSLADRLPVGMMSIVYDMSPEQSDLTNSRLRRQLGQDAATFLTRYCAKVKQEFDELQRSNQFSIGVEYSLVLTKKKDGADIILSSGPTDSEPTRIVQVPKDPSASHPLRQKEVIERLKTELPGIQINQHDIYCVNKVYNIKAKPDYFYQGKIKGSPPQYSHTFVDWVIRKYHNDNEFFSKTRDHSRKLGQSKA